MFSRASAFGMTVVLSMSQRMGSAGLHLLNREMTTRLINANIPLLCGRLKGAEAGKCFVVFPLRDSGRERHLTARLTEPG